MELFPFVKIWQLFAIQDFFLHLCVDLGELDNIVMKLLQNKFSTHPSLSSFFRVVIYFSRFIYWHNMWVLTLLNSLLVTSSFLTFFVRNWLRIPVIRLQYLFILQKQIDELQHQKDSLSKATLLDPILDITDKKELDFVCHLYILLAFILLCNLSVIPSHIQLFWIRSLFIYLQERRYCMLRLY